jgi:hypothetical protein
MSPTCSHALLFLKNNQQNFRHSIIQVFWSFYFLFLFFGCFCSWSVFFFILDLPKVPSSQKKAFLSKFGSNMLQVDEESKSFLSLMHKVKRSQRCRKWSPIIDSVYEKKPCFFFHGEIERGRIQSFWKKRGFAEYHMKFLCFFQWF